jgi:hypothetical protein
MQSGNEPPFQPGAQGGPKLELELISSDAMFAGTINLGAYSRLSDLLNFHDEVLSVADGAVLTQTGDREAHEAPQLDIRLTELTLVIDRSNYVPPPDTEQIIEKKQYQLLAVTDAYVITATFFIYAGAEATPYLRAAEPRWIPITDVKLHSLVDRKIEYSADFAVLHRKPLLATAVI